MLATKEGEWILNLAIGRHDHDGFKIEKYLQRIAPDKAAKTLSNVPFVMVLSGRGIAPMDERTFLRFQGIDTNIGDFFISQNQSSEMGPEYLVCKTEKLISAVDFINAYGLFPEAITLNMARQIGTKDIPRGRNLAEEVIHDYRSNRYNFLNHPISAKQRSSSRLKRAGSRVLGIGIACLMVINTVLLHERKSINEENTRLAKRIEVNQKIATQASSKEAAIDTKSSTAKGIADIINSVPSLNLTRLNYHPVNEKSLYRGDVLNIGESISIEGYSNTVSEIVNLRNQIQSLDWVLTCKINTLERSDPKRISYQISINE